jgi:hypothetical protein
MNHKLNVRRLGEFRDTSKPLNAKAIGQREKEISDSIPTRQPVIDYAPVEAIPQTFLPGPKGKITTDFLVIRNDSRSHHISA